MHSSLKNRLEHRVRSLLLRFGLEIRRVKARPFPEASDCEMSLISRISPYTMTSQARCWTMLKALQYIRDAGISGDVVECGVWRGGLVILSKLVLASQSRHYFLYDTFAGLTEPSDLDATYDGTPTRPTWERMQQQTHNDWCYASLEDVRMNFEREGVAGQDVIFCQGDVAVTLRNEAMLPDSIAVLRLDTDWYESTKIELEVLYPRLVRGGVLIIDDYGQWAGQKKAVDEYFAGKPLLLVPVDFGCRMAIKL